MNASSSLKQPIIQQARLIPTDYLEIYQCRRLYNRLGFTYQLIFVRLTHRFPIQQPFEINEEILEVASSQLGTAPENIQPYAQRQATLSNHQDRIKRRHSTTSP